MRSNLHYNAAIILSVTNPDLRMALNTLWLTETLKEFP